MTQHDSERGATRAIDWDALFRVASEVRARAYAPYSRFSVGAAVLGDDGATYAGANVENASYGLALCAERAAIARGVADGARRFAAVAVVADGARGFVTPCGMCRQVLLELARDAAVRCYAPDGSHLATDVRALVPFPFEADELESRR